MPRFTNISTDGDTVFSNMEVGKRPYCNDGTSPMMSREQRCGLADGFLSKSASATSVQNASLISADTSHVWLTPKSKSFESQHRVTFSECQLECCEPSGEAPPNLLPPPLPPAESGAGEPSAAPCAITYDDRQPNGTKPTSPADAQPKAPILRIHRTPSEHSHDNPFVADGELSQKADYILRHSTISRTQVSISDPDNAPADPANDAVDAPAPPSPDGQPAAPGEGVARPGKENGSAEEPLTAQAVQVEVGRATATQAQPQSAEHVKLKADPKCKCCVLL